MLLLLQLSSMDRLPRRPPRLQIQQGRCEVLVPVAVHAEQTAEVVVGPDGAPDGPPPCRCCHQTSELVPGRQIYLVVVDLRRVAKCAP